VSEKTKVADVTTLITRFRAPPNVEPSAFVNGLVELLMAGARFHGFWSGEMMPPASTGSTDSREWRLIQRFSTDDHTVTWRNSGERKLLLDSIASLTNGDAPEFSDEICRGAESGGVTTAIITDVRPETQDDYFAWECAIQSAQAKFPGYYGNYLQPPVPGRPGKWTTLLKFESPESLEKWFESDERKKLLAQADKFVSSTQFQQMTSSFPGWFPVDQLTGKGPPNWKTAMLVLLGLFPTVIVAFWVF
jgi:antibiotic biosynthesis monooxygenase (ABM) superfamily enzyme